MTPKMTIILYIITEGGILFVVKILCHNNFLVCIAYIVQMHVNLTLSLLCVVSTVADVWECSGGRGGVSPQSLGSLLSTHQHSRDSSAAEATGHCLFLPP